VSQDPYGQQDPYRSGNYEDYSQGYSSPPQQPAPSYGQPPFQQPGYGQAPTDPYGQPTYSDPTYGQAPYTQPGYGQGYQATPSYGLAPYSAAIDSNPRPSVTMPQAVKLWLKNWKNFSGRASRSEFWWTELALAIAGTVIGIIFAVIAGVIFATTAAAASATGSAPDAAITAILLIFYGLFGLLGLATFIPSLALSVRRLHDTNQSGWMYLLAFIPYVGGIILLVLMAQPSNAMGARFDDRAQPLYGPENI
jgi:uncharacterized membrane protein YhaH (DUF805 family)